MLADKRAAVIGPFEDDGLAGEISEADGSARDVLRAERRRRRPGPRGDLRLGDTGHRKGYRGGKQEFRYELHLSHPYEAKISPSRRIDASACSCGSPGHWQRMMK